MFVEVRGKKQLGWGGGLFGSPILKRVKAKQIHITFTVLSENYKIFFSLQTTKNIIVFSALSKVPVKLIFWFAFGSSSRSCCLIKFIAIILYCSFKCG